MQTMSMTLDQLVEESRQLPQDMRAELVERILLSAHGGIAPKIDEAWRQETLRRIAEIQSGQARAIPLDEALAQSRKRVGL
jgi:putative addiction module component (TIGR02574 family)